MKAFIIYALALAFGLLGGVVGGLSYAAFHTSLAVPQSNAAEECEALATEYASFEEPSERPFAFNNYYKDCLYSRLYDKY